MQVAVDIITPPSVFEAVEAAATAHFKANPTEFSGEKMIIANVVGDPLKYLLCCWWEYAYPGNLLHLWCRMPCMNVLIVPGVVYPESQGRSSTNTM